MKDKYLKILYAIVLVGIVIALVLSLASEEFDTLLALNAEGTYLIHEEALIPREDADILLAAENKLYLYYKNSELLNVYSTDGQFLYGIQFPDYQNGIATFLYMDGLLYADIPLSGIYIFDDCALVRYDDSTAYYLEIRDLFTEEYPNSDGEYTYIYVAETNRVLRTGKGEPEVLLRFPQKNPHYAAILWLLFFWILGGCRYWDKSKILDRY